VDITELSQKAAATRKAVERLHSKRLYSIGTGGEPILGALRRNIANIGFEIERIAAPLPMLGHVRRVFL
jgi:hypothetical protein